MIPVVKRLKTSGLRTFQVRRYHSYEEFIAAIQSLQLKQANYSWQKWDGEYYIRLELQ